MEERTALEALLRAQATSRPSTALREGRLADTNPIEDAQLGQVRLLKRSLTKERFLARNIGQLRQGIGKRDQLPPNRHQGYFCFHHVSKIGEKPTCMCVATTKALQERWVDSSHLPAAIDGGWKLNPSDGRCMPLDP